jgi:curved DNA-binding protein CbpA
MPSAIMAAGPHRNGGNVTRPRAADDFAAIRARMEELRLERYRTLAGQEASSGLGADRSRASEDEGQGERRLPRSAILRKIVR